MKLYNLVLIPVLLAAMFMFGCDASEDPNLLNPPLPDSTGIRVINLLPEGTVDVGIPGLPIATAVGPAQVSPFSNLLVREQTVVVVRRSLPSVRFDTVYNQTLAQGTRMTYVVLGSPDTTLIRSFGTGQQERADLLANGEARLGFVNGVSDTASYFIKSGCMSGPILFNNTPFGDATPRTITTKAPELSLYLFSSADSMPVTSARLQMPAGTVSHVIAATIGGRVRLFLLQENTAGVLLPEAPLETRTTANVALLNALSDGSTLSARIDGASGDFAVNVPALSISPSTEIEACHSLSGDQLLVREQGGAEYRTPISLAVGSNSLMVVYPSDTAGQVRTIILGRDRPSPAGGNVYIRGVNVSTHTGGTSISIGAGAPSPINADYRPFGTLLTGRYTDYVKIPSGAYPFILSSAQTGKFLDGGVETLEPGYYTLFAIDDAGVPSIRILKDDEANASLQTLESNGARVTFFNVMSDANATFTAGPLTLAPLPYSYVYTTLVPYDVKTIGSNAGTVPVDLVAGSYTIGTTGTQSAPRIMAFRSPSDTLPPKIAAIRFLNAVPDAPELPLRIAESRSEPLTMLPFGTPSETFRFDARKYSFFITKGTATTGPDTTSLARADGVELLSGRHYLMVIAPKRVTSSSKTTYEIFFIQE